MNLYTSNNSKKDDFAGFPPSEIMAICFPPKQICKHILAQFPAATSNQCPPHWSYLVSVPLPLLSQNGRISMLPVRSDRLRQGVQADTPGSGTEGSGEDGRSECKQSLSLNCHWGSGALCVCVRPRPQDKNVFDIVCNCVMFTLLVSEQTGVWLSAVVGWSIPFRIQWETARSLDMGLSDGTKCRGSFYRNFTRCENIVKSFRYLFLLLLFFIYFFHCMSEWTGHWTKLPNCIWNS